MLRDITFHTNFRNPAQFNQGNGTTRRLQQNINVLSSLKDIVSNLHAAWETIGYLIIM